MIERFAKYFETLEGLSTEELDRSVEMLVRGEKKRTALVIAHIAEMSRRKGALERGYKNLFDYCVRRLSLSEGSVALRIQVANVCRRFPQILAALAENRVSVTVAGLLAPHLSEDNVEKLLAQCAGMTRREAEEHLVALRPKPVFAPSIRKVPEPAKRTEARPASSTPLPVSSPPAPRRSPAMLQPATPANFNFRFAASPEFKAKFERLAEVLGVNDPLVRMEEIFEKALDAALDKKDPKRKLGRRRKREAKKSRPGEETSRYVPSEVRERVHARASYQCEFRGPDGMRCRGRAGLEIEHVKPFALYRSHDEKSLRLYCRAHNRWSAERVYGAAYIQEKIDASRTRSP